MICDILYIAHGTRTTTLEDTSVIAKPFSMQTRHIIFILQFSYLCYFSNR